MPSHDGYAYKNRLTVSLYRMQGSYFYFEERIMKTSYGSYAGPHSVFDIGHCTVVHFDAGGVSLVDK